MLNTIFTRKITVAMISDLSSRRQHSLFLWICFALSPCLEFVFSSLQNILVPTAMLSVLLLSIARTSPCSFSLKHSLLWVELQHLYGLNVKKIHQSRIIDKPYRFRGDRISWQPYSTHLRVDMIASCNAVHNAQAVRPIKDCMGEVTNKKTNP